MAVTVHFEGGTRAGEVIQFDDEVEIIRFGRDSGRCQVAFPPDETKIGREHCSLRRLQRVYELQVDHNHQVFINGELAIGGEELQLATDTDLQLGSSGPKFVVTCNLDSQLPPTDSLEQPAIGKATMLKDAHTNSQKAALTAVVALIVTAAVVSLYFLLFWAL